MKARLISENVNFERGLDPKDSMGIGQGVLKSYFDHKFTGPKTSMEEAEDIIKQMDIAMRDAMDGEDQEYAFVWAEDSLLDIGWYEVHEPLNIIEGVNFERGGNQKTIMKRILGNPGLMKKHRFNSRSPHSMVFIQGLNQKWYEIAVWMREPGRGGKKALMFFPERDYEEFQYDPGELEDFSKWEKNKFHEIKDTPLIKDDIERTTKNLGVIPYPGEINESNFVRGGSNSQKLGRILGYQPGTLLRIKDLGTCLMAYSKDQYLRFAFIKKPDIPGEHQFFAYDSPTIENHDTSKVELWNAEQMEFIESNLSRRPRLQYQLAQYTTAKPNFEMIKESVNFERGGTRAEKLKRILGPQIGSIYMDRNRFPTVYMLVGKEGQKGKFKQIAMIQGGGQKPTKLRYYSPHSTPTYTVDIDSKKEVSKKVWDMLQDKNIDFGSGDYWKRIEEITGISVIKPIFESVRFERGASGDDIKRELRATGPYQPGEIVVRDMVHGYGKNLHVYMEYIPSNVLAPHQTHAFGTIDSGTGDASFIHYTGGSGVAGLQDNDILRRATREEAKEIRKALQSGKFDKYIENVKKNTGLTPFV